MKAEEVYSFSYADPTHGNPVVTGEGGAAPSGVYCFNLINLQTGTYQFWLRIEEPTLYTPTTSTLIGPITIEVTNDPAEEFFRVGNDFGNAQITRRPPGYAGLVGGTFTTVNKGVVLAPFLALIGALTTVTAIFVVKRRRKA